jgi:hypothetical protein
MSKSKCKWFGVGAVLVALQGVFGSEMEAATYKDAVLADGPRYYWTFDEASGSALNYGLASGGTLGVQNGATRAASGTTNAGVNSLSLGTASEHNGVDRAFHTTAAGGTSISDGTYTSYAYEFWVKPTVTPNEWYLMETHDPTNRSVMLLGYQASNRHILEYYTGGGGRTTTDGPVLLPNTWNHLIVGFKENGATDTTTFYLNGSLAGTSTAVSDRVLFSEGANQFIVGGSQFNGVSHEPTGLLDEIAIYDLSSLAQVDYDAKLAALASHYFAAVPEPGALSLTLCAMSLLAGCRMRQKDMRRQ